MNLTTDIDLHSEWSSTVEAGTLIPTAGNTIMFPDWVPDFNIAYISVYMVEKTIGFSEYV